MEDSRPTPKHNPMANNEATAVFYDFNKPLSDASCSMLASELADHSPKGKTLDPKIIKVVHQALRSKFEEKEEDVRELLPAPVLGLFLDLCDFRIVSADATEEVVMQGVEAALRYLQLAISHFPSITGARHTTTDGTTADYDKLANFCVVLNAVLSVIKAYDPKVENAMKQTAEEHAVHLQNTTIKDILHKMSNSVNVASMRELAEQSGHPQLIALSGALCQMSSEELGIIQEALEKILLAWRGQVSTGLSKEEAMKNLDKHLMECLDAYVVSHYQRPCYLTLEQRVCAQRLHRECDRMIAAEETGPSEELDTAIARFMQAVDPEHPWLKEHARLPRRSKGLDDLRKKYRKMPMHQTVIGIGLNAEEDDDDQNMDNMDNLDIDPSA